MRKNKLQDNNIKPTFNKSKSPIIIFLFVIIIIFLLINIFFVSQQKELLEKNFSEYQSKTSQEINFFEKEINSLEKNIFELENEKNILQLNLEQLTINYNDLEITKNQLNQDYFLLKEEVDSTIQKIDSYEKEIQDSMEWFKTNSTLSEKQRNILLNLKTNCLTQKKDSCEINIACFDLINSEFNNFFYKDDDITSNSFDKLQSIEQFVSNKGGDCEDFALMFKAEYNSLIANCVEQKKEIVLFTWVHGKEKYWLNNSSTWYFENAKKVFLEKNYFYPTIVCGNIYDLQSQKVNGHCVIAFAKQKIISISDLNELNNAPIIEPQNGFYLGKINSDSNINLIDFKKSDSFISVVITDDDYFLYSNDHWNNYSEFKKQLHEKKESLQLLIQ